MKHEAAVKILAKEFSRLLVKQLGKAKVQKVNRLNLEETDSGVCHSHDFCDANMVMAAAIRRSGLMDKPQLWNDAWRFAVKNRFFVK